MSLIEQLPGITRESREAYEKILAASPPRFAVSESHGANDERNQIALGDNLEYMAWLINERQMAGKVDLIYIDPPFFTKSDFVSDIKLHSERVRLAAPLRQEAYSDRFDHDLPTYLAMLAVRFYLMRDLLKDTGSLFVHLDWHAVHYVKVLLDEIFGENQFRNEIIWHYKSGGVSRRHFARKHDTILFYSKTDDYYFQPQQEKSYNRDYKPYRFKGVREYRDEQGWYTWVNRKDVWQIPMVGRTSAERTGYVTQKPEALADRIIESGTRPGDLCADFFGGSGTFAASAERLGRRWLTGDAGELACLHICQRLARANAAFDVYESPTVSDAVRPAEVEARATVEPLAASDRQLLRVELVGYRLTNSRDYPIAEADLPLLQGSLREDPLLLISSWSVDPRGEETAHRPERLMIRERDHLPAVFETIGQSFGPVYVQVTDLFGNRRRIRLTVEDGEEGSVGAVPSSP